MKMEQIFLHVFNMSISAGWLVLAVMLLRLLLKKAPKWVNCVLWGVVVLRLIMPFSIESVLSLIPSAETLPPNITVADTPMINSGLPPVNMVINPVISETFKPMPGNIANPMQTVMLVAAIVWLAGIGLMIVYGAVSYLRVRYKVRVSLSAGQGVYYCDGIDTPFILGVFRPRIYLPSGIDASCAEYVLRHERAHLKRRDHLWKPLGFALLTVYWFNPLLWVAYILFCRDIEKACDEKVIRDMSDGDKKGYSSALLDCSVHQRRLIMACPLAFGEVGVKSRIKSVLNYKKPAFWIIIVAIVAVTVTCICFLTNPPKDDKGDDLPKYDVNSPNVDLFGDAPTRTLSELKAQCPQLFGLDTSEGLHVTAWAAGNGKYYCGLLDGNANLDSYKTVWSCPFVTVEEMKLILNDYALKPGQVFLATSDTETYDFVSKQIDLDFIRVHSQGLYYTDMAMFDVDFDGTEELCLIGSGPTSGVYSIGITVCNLELAQAEYYSKLYAYNSCFVNDGENTYLQYVTYGHPSPPNYEQVSSRKIVWCSGIETVDLGTHGEHKMWKSTVLENSVLPLKEVSCKKIKISAKNGEEHVITEENSCLHLSSLLREGTQGIITEDVASAKNAEYTLDFYDGNGALVRRVYLFNDGMISTDEYTEDGVCNIIRCYNLAGAYAYLEQAYNEPILKCQGMAVSKVEMYMKREVNSVAKYDKLYLRVEDVSTIIDYINAADLSHPGEEVKGYEYPNFKIKVTLATGIYIEISLWNENECSYNISGGKDYMLKGTDAFRPHEYLLDFRYYSGPFDYDYDMENIDPQSSVKRSGFKTVAPIRVDQKETALDIALLECTVKYSSITVSDDYSNDMWRVTFHCDSGEYASQTVYVNRDDGRIQLCVWEKR